MDAPLFAGPGAARCRVEDAVSLRGPADQERIEERARLRLFVGDPELEPTNEVRVGTIQLAVAARYGIPAREMATARRLRPIAHARQVAIYLSHELTPHSLATIGRLFGGRDHSTVHYAIQQVEQRRRVDPALDRDIRALATTLLTGKDWADVPAAA